MPTALELMKLHAETPFLHDDQCRIVAVNDVDRRSAPRIYLGRAVDGNIWRFRQDLALDLAVDLETFLVDERVATNLERRALRLARG